MPLLWARAGWVTKRVPTVVRSIEEHWMRMCSVIPGLTVFEGLERP